MIEKNLVDKVLKQRKLEIEGFSYAISHELKSPLVTISSFLEFLKEDIKNMDEKRIEESFFYLENAVTKMNLLIANLAELNQLNLSPLNREVLETEKILHAIVSNLNERYNAKEFNSAFTLFEDNIESKFNIVIQNDLPNVFMDKNKFISIFNQLLLNAINHGKSIDLEKQYIHIFYKKIAGENCFCVQDFGIGIEKKHQSRIFDLFEKLNHKLNGNGVGLFIVSKIIDLCHGKVWLESSPKQGSLFWVSFGENTVKQEVM